MASNRAQYCFITKKLNVLVRVYVYTFQHNIILYMYNTTGFLASFSIFMLSHDMWVPRAPRYSSVWREN